MISSSAQLIHIRVETCLSSPPARLCAHDAPDAEEGHDEPGACDDPVVALEALCDRWKDEACGAPDSRDGAGWTRRRAHAPLDAEGAGRAREARATRGGVVARERETIGG